MEAERTTAVQLKHILLVNRLQLEWGLETEFHLELVHRRRNSERCRLQSIAEQMRQQYQHNNGTGRPRRLPITGDQIFTPHRMS